MKTFAFSQVQLLRTTGRHLYTKQLFVLQPSLILRSNKDGKRGMERLRLCTLGCSPGVLFHGGAQQGCAPGLWSISFWKLVLTGSIYKRPFIGYRHPLTAGGDGSCDAGWPQWHQSILCVPQRSTWATAVTWHQSNPRKHSLSVCSFLCTPALTGQGMIFKNDH